MLAALLQLAARDGGAAHHRHVVGDGGQGLPRVPGVGDGAVRPLLRADGAAEADGVGDLRPLEFPGVAEAQPVLRQLLLHAVHHDLAEQPVLVADAVAEGGDAERRHALHEAGGQAAQSAVAQGGVGFLLLHVVDIDAIRGQGGADRLGQAQVAHGVEQQPADQELQR